MPLSVVVIVVVVVGGGGGGSDGDVGGVVVRGRKEGRRDREGETFIASIAFLRGRFSA